MGSNTSYQFKTIYQFKTAGKILFGEGASEQLATEARAYGSRAFVVVGQNTSRFAHLLDALQAAGISIQAFSVPSEPTLSAVIEGLSCARDFQPALVIGIGGGSVIDAGKAIAALLANTGEPLDYLEVVGKGLPMERDSLAYIAVPTTSGTGAETTRNAVLKVESEAVKVSMRSPSMYPAVALIDPELTRSLPLSVRASTGLDALTQLIEAYTTPFANPMTDALCREAIPAAARALKSFVDGEGGSFEREKLSQASFFSGIALANAGLGAVHGFAGPMGGMFDIAHGVLCARFLPGVIEANILALRSRDPQALILSKYDELAVMLGLDSIEKSVVWLGELVQAFDIPNLSSLGVKADHIDSIVAKAKRASSMKGNPVSLTDEELAGLVEDNL